MEESINVQLLLLGDSSVGKTSFLKKCIHNSDKHNNELTIGVDYATKSINIDNTKINLQIWDTAGQESFRSVTTSYFRNSNCALVFFDISNIDSYNNVEYWINTYLSISQNPRSSILLIGNKNDNIMRDVSNKDCLDLANDLKVLYIEISVHRNTINDLNEIILQLLNNIDLKKNTTKYTVSLETKKEKILCGLKKCLI